jgi:hypothetical protein
LKKAVYAILVAVLGWAFVEAVTFSVLSVREGALATPSFFAGLRAVDVGEAPTGEALLATMQRTTGRQVLHPYLGFVLDAENPEVLNINRLGFQRSYHERPPYAESWQNDSPCSDAGRQTVAVFGGSVALIFSHLGSDSLFEALGDVPAWEGACARSFALGGYKQPQQLQALTYLLALGEQIDVVINLDGFNEVTLPYLENLPLDGFYAYPRKWPLLTQTAPDPREQNLRGEVSYLRRLRGERARTFSPVPFSYSAVWNLIWLYQDQRLASEISELEATHLARTTEERVYERHGPRNVFKGRAELFTELAALWERSSLAMHQLCSARGIRYYHFLQPNQYVPGSKVLTARELSTAFAAQGRYRSAVETGYPHLVAAGARLAAAGVDFHDLTGVFGDVDETLYIDDCCHFNARGAELLALEMARRIRSGG